MARVERDKFEEQAVEEFRAAFRTYFDTIEPRLQADKGSASIGFTVGFEERPDGEFDVTYEGRCKLPVKKGELAKARFEKGQLTLL